MKLVSTLCDPHAGEHKAKERTITIDGEKLIIDACDGYIEDLKRFSRNNNLTPIDPANGVVKSKGPLVPAKKAVAAKAAVATKKTAAPIAVAPPATGMRAADEDFPCFACTLSLKQGSWPGHARTHGFATSGDMVGDHCPLCNAKHGRLTNHAKEEHGVANVALLFQTAIRDGDPHGIVGKRIKAAKNVKLT